MPHTKLLQASMTAGSSAMAVQPEEPLCKPEQSPKRRRRPRMSRLVSLDSLQCGSSDALPPPLPNPLEDPSMMAQHTKALRLEADLFPLRLILTRLMAHATHNPKGLFNVPVDAVSLGLPDYPDIIPHPMDLGTVKERLYGVAYPRRSACAGEIRLVFWNAMRYNPVHNMVHTHAKALLEFFEAAYQLLAPSGSPSHAQDDDALWKPHKQFVDAMAASAALTKTIVPVAARSGKRLTLSFADESVTPLATTPQPSPRSAGNTPAGSTTKKALTIALPAQTPTTRLSTTPRCGTRSSGGTPRMQDHLMETGRRPSRKSSISKHSCRACLGRTCGVCQQGCLLHEPTLLICSGAACAGAKIRKGGMYYISADGAHQYCPKCYAGLPPSLAQDSTIYKRDLLKRRNDEEIPEEWISCSSCGGGVHQVCAMVNPMVHATTEYQCPSCSPRMDIPVPEATAVQEAPSHQAYSFVSGSEHPVPLHELGSSESSDVTAFALQECEVSRFIQAKVRKQVQGITHADETVHVRVISESDKSFAVPDVVRKHFRMAAEDDVLVSPPTTVRYHQRAIALFQTIDGVDVCIFCMYVQEYNGEDVYEEDPPVPVQAAHAKRVYIAYLDSVEHFRPRSCRTAVYQEMLVAYLASARLRGFDSAQIWACPPSRGNSFVFWNHPASQKTPNMERLVGWYHNALSRAMDRGVVSQVKSLYESDFKDLAPEESSPQLHGKMICPPLLEGDFWVEEASRLHARNLARYMRIRSPNEVCDVWNVATAVNRDIEDPCPAVQMWSMIRKRVMTHPAAHPFCKPVNAAALGLVNYHSIVAQPMDFGTVSARCVLGEYERLEQVIADVELVVANAKTFNPPGHFVHIKADEIRDIFFQELKALCKFWKDQGALDDDDSIPLDMSMSLDHLMVLSKSNEKVQTPDVAKGVIIEDDRSMDACSSSSSRSTSSASASSGARKRPATKKLQTNLQGPAAIAQCMSGEDSLFGDQPSSKRRRLSVEDEASTAKSCKNRRRPQAWLGQEVAESVRRMRTSLFYCSLMPASDKDKQIFEEYAQDYNLVACSAATTKQAASNFCQARSAVLEFCQYRHLEFDTLRRAKYSTRLLLYHLLHGSKAPGSTPACSHCHEAIQNVRWHQVSVPSAKERSQELCADCHKANGDQQNSFIPIPVSNNHYPSKET